MDVPREYAFYNFANDAEDAAELLDADRREGRYLSAVVPGDRIVGFYELKPPDGGSVELGLGLRPDLTGRGLGREFVRRGCALAYERHGAVPLTLRVAEFNLRALRVYPRVGFVQTGLEIAPSNGTLVEFVQLQLPAPNQAPPQPAE
ncbi:MAG: GNAT family N-acetyltransferase [Actinomycetota bacterium]|nr:GNAT family N-acetyltransferase [Actinomycetota bacterium]